MSRREVFRFLAYAWDVDKAQQIAENLPIQRFNPEPWFSWIAAIRVNDDHMPNVDLERPVIVVRLREADGAPMIIDGWHRIAKAQRDGVSELPVVVLDETTSTTCGSTAATSNSPPAEPSTTEPQPPTRTGRPPSSEQAQYSVISECQQQQKPPTRPLRSPSEFRRICRTV